ncbi:21S rRNA (GM2251-2'-O)-methyltransferase [Entomortierella parvispora]|uniref:rRNA methyltransferase 1, mitochondrial n=1 Tax=Entomortierella parvispora TaxID=205924 RepID=A0A9P3H0V7_9FUNG|nr:21S rRNA (GM2251-2'-O)-methyltransferase [Entomortierella parvispora]
MAHIYRTLVAVRSSSAPLNRIGSLYTQRCFNTSAILLREDRYGDGSGFERRDKRKKASSSYSGTSRRQDAGGYGRSSSSSSDPFDKLDTGKYGRSSFPSREESSSSSSSSSSPSRSFQRSDRPSSSDRYGYGSQNGSRSYDRERSSSFGSGSDRRVGGKSQSAGTRTYDPEFSPTRRGGPSQNMDPDRDYLYSPNVVLPAMLNGYRTPYKLYYSQTVTQNRKKYKDDPVKDCIDAATREGIPVVKTDRHELNTMAGQRPHQGVILEASRLKDNAVVGLSEVSVEDNTYSVMSKTNTASFTSKANQPPIWVACDQVVDPQNLGAILRTSMFLGVDGVVVCTKNSSPLSAVVAKASVGALEARPTYSVRSLMKFIQNSQKNGWHVVGAHVTYGSKRNRPLQKWPDTGVTQPTILVMGGEGDGIRKQIQNQCDSFIQIPNLSQIETNVDSLNVGVATGIILSKLMGGRFLSLPEKPKKNTVKKRLDRGEGLLDGGHGDDEEDDDEDEDEDDKGRNDDDNDDNGDDDEEEEAEKPKKSPKLPF